MKFDNLYEKGKLENLQVREAIAVSEWENPYFTREEPKQLAYAFGDYFVAIRSCLEGYEYSVLEGDYSLINDGIYLYKRCFKRCFRGDYGARRCTLSCCL